MICALKTRGNTGLQDAIALSDALFYVVINGLVNRMSHGSHELPNRVARQLRVCVECDDIPNLVKNGCSPDDTSKVIAGLPAQKRVQLLKLAPFALIAHPQSLGRIPAA